MRIETVADVVQWGADFHHGLAEFLPRCLADADSTRLQLMGDYVARRQGHLAETVAALTRTESEQSLGTWVMEFLSQQPLPKMDDGNTRWLQFDEDDLLAEVVDMHEQLIDLYRYLLSRCMATPAAETFEQLIAMEQHELGLVAQGANRLRDI